MRLVEMETTTNMSVIQLTVLTSASTTLTWKIIKVNECVKLFHIQKPVLALEF